MHGGHGGDHTGHQTEANQQHHGGA
jgi:hypothetical protein